MKRPKGFVTRQAKRLSDGEINRRRFVMSALSAGVTMPTALSLASKAEAQVPKAGGTLRMALAAGCPSDGLDPLQANNAFTRTLAFAHANALVEISPDGDVIGELAESFEPSSDFRRWRFTLRPDVVFHDGTPFTADVALHNLEAWVAAGQIPVITEASVVAPDQLDITLREGQQDFPRSLADPRFVLLSPQSTPDHPVGTGPYRISRFEPGRLVELRRAPDYWKAGRGHFDSVQLISLPDALARQTALMTGEADFADRIDPRGVALLQREPTLAVSETEASRSLNIAFAQDAQVPDQLRTAFLKSIPANAIVERVLLGHGSCDGVDCDLDAVRDLLGQTGHGGTLKLIVDSDPVAQEAARLIAGNAASAGLGIQIIGEEQNADLALRMRDAAAPMPPGDHVILKVHDLSAQTKRLSRIPTSLANPGKSDERLVECAWFA